MKKYNPLKICMLALVTLAFVLPVQAEGKDKKEPSKRMLKKYDLNKDGMISDAERAEVKAMAKKTRAEKRVAELAKYDENKDGKINKNERVKIKADRAAVRDAKKAKREAERAAKKMAKEK